MDKITAINVGYLDTDCYIITDGTVGIVVDPGGDYDKIAAKLFEAGVKADAVLLTHGHFDHILALPRLKTNGAAVYVHEADERMLRNEDNLADVMGLPPIETVRPDVILRGDEDFYIGSFNIKVIHTPGHTKGSCCFDVDGKYLFSGDTLFCGSYGRTDFPSGSTTELVGSIKKLFSIEGDRIVYPGHGESTTLSYEREYNPISVYL